MTVGEGSKSVQFTQPYTTVHYFKLLLSGWKNFSSLLLLCTESPRVIVFVCMRLQFTHFTLFYYTLTNFLDLIVRADADTVTALTNDHNFMYLCALLTLTLPLPLHSWSFSSTACLIASCCVFVCRHDNILQLHSTTPFNNSTQPSAACTQ